MRVREGGADEVTPHLFDVDARKDLADVFPKGRYSGFSILNDKSGVYLTRDTAEGPRVFFHKIGTETASDTEIFGKGYGPENIIGSGVTRDNHYLQIAVQHGSSGDHTEIYVQDLAAQRANRYDRERHAFRLLWADCRRPHVCAHQLEGAEVARDGS